jgi:hypothetical protein
MAGLPPPEGFRARDMPIRPFLAGQAFEPEVIREMSLGSALHRSRPMLCRRPVATARKISGPPSVAPRRAYCACASARNSSLDAAGTEVFAGNGADDLR